jgi:hypothetical protein
MFHISNVALVIVACFSFIHAQFTTVPDYIASNDAQPNPKIDYVRQWAIQTARA